MAKKLIGKRELNKILEDRTLLVQKALESGHITKIDICKATGLKIVALNNLFRDNRELYAEYVVLRRTITDIAADNIVAIVMDKTHPKNYDASKEIMKMYKTELDESLDAKDGDHIKIEGGGSGSPINIVFGK